MYLLERIRLLQEAMFFLLELASFNKYMGVIIEFSDETS